jgi:hypothetical protein
MSFVPPDGKFKLVCHSKKKLPWSDYNNMITQLKKKINNSNVII